MLSLVNSNITNRGQKMSINNIEVKIMLVTPDLAEQFLHGQNDNRKVNKTAIDKYVGDMISGLWKPYAQPLMFDINDKMIDGQHRCHSVIKSGIPQTFITLWNIPTDIMQVLDTGLKRKTSHVGQILGLDVNDKMTSTVNHMFLLDQSSKIELSSSKILELFDKYEDGVRFACKYNKGLALYTSAMLRALIAKAYYYENHSDLDRFMRVFLSGVPETNDDIEALHIRNYHLSKKADGVGFGQYSQIKPYYLLAQQALIDFLLGKTSDKIELKKKTDYYPLPDQTSMEYKKRLEYFEYNLLK
jgi:hypothetical protein